MVNKAVRDREQANKKKDRQNEQESVISYTELLQLICVQYGIVSFDYFLDKMKPYELVIICDSLHLRTKDSWEQSRMIAYIIAQVNSKKHLKPTDIITFGWEKQNKDTKKNSAITVDEVEQIKKVALEREKLLKEKGII